jgi:hypothetical protein
MPGIKRLPPDSRESRVSQTSTAAVSPFAQAPPEPRSNQTRRLSDQDLAAVGGSFGQGNDWLDFVSKNSNSFDTGLGYSFSPINSAHVEHRAFASPFDQSASHIGLSNHLYGEQSTSSDSEISWSDYKPSAQEGCRYRQGGRQEDETQGHNTQLASSGAWASFQRDINPGDYT